MGIYAGWIKDSDSVNRGSNPRLPAKRNQGVAVIFAALFFASFGHKWTHLFMAFLALLLSGCASVPTAARIDGFNAQARGFEMLESEPFEPFVAEVKVRVRIIPQDTRGGTYWHPEGLIVIQGKKINGKIVTCPAIVGHEFQHALQFQTGNFADPDKFEEFGY